MANPITVSIDFGSMNTGLGQSSTLINDLSYSQYRSDLANNQILSSNDSLALASLPVASTNPVNGNAAVVLTLPNLRAIGETALGNKGGEFDSTIRLNLSDINLSRTGPQDPTKYDLQAVTTHEIDEVLGIGGTGSKSGIGHENVSSAGAILCENPLADLMSHARGEVAIRAKGRATVHCVHPMAGFRCTMVLTAWGSVRKIAV